MASWSKLLMFSIFLLLWLPTSILFANASNDDTVTVVLTNTEEISASAYEAILEAEQAGANVSSLLDRLNLGGENLADIEDLRSEALALRDEAKSLRETNFVVTVVGSVVSMVIVVVSCFFAWHVFRRRYLRRVLGSRPEVVSGES